MSHPKTKLSTGYVVRQIEAALQRSNASADETEQARAYERLPRWTQLLDDMHSGKLVVGSRTPVENTPAWVTLDVVQGGFATGVYTAGGALMPHEVEASQSMSGDWTPEKIRFELNNRCLTDEGQASLLKLLDSGHYRVTVPEEGALLSVAWLLANRCEMAAQDILETIAPFFNRLRFYPVPATKPAGQGREVFRQPWTETVRQIAPAAKGKQHVERMNESLSVWLPLYDQLITLFIDTVTGEIPHFAVGPGTFLRDQSNQPLVEGGWPCQRYPEGWTAQVISLLTQVDTQRRQHALCKKPIAPKGQFARLLSYAQHCVADSTKLTGHEVGAIRRIVAGFVSSSGVPGEPAHQALRQRQLTMSALPVHRAIKAVLVARLQNTGDDEAFTELSPMVEPVTPQESSQFGVSAKLPIPPHLQAKMARSWKAPVRALVERKVIGSGEVLARVAPQFTAQIQAGKHDDSQVRRLSASLYSAFRKRRSLLLLDYQSQVKFHELPWVAALSSKSVDAKSAQPVARQTLKEVLTLSITAFPQAIIPNKLLQEVRALSQGSGLAVPWVGELAADIFMGEFAKPFLDAAQVAARMLHHSLYARYYRIPYDAVLGFESPTAVADEVPLSAPLSELCRHLAGPLSASARSVVANGRVIEQAQIVTTHNLAVAFDTFNLTSTLAPQLVPLATQTFTWVCRTLAMRQTHRRAQLHAVKNAAYAWRQMIFFLSLARPIEWTVFFDTVKLTLTRFPVEFQQRFRPALADLEQIANFVFDTSSAVGEQSRFGPFLGWSSVPHWAVEPLPNG